MNNSKEKNHRSSNRQSKPKLRSNGSLPNLSSHRKQAAALFDSHFELIQSSCDYVASSISNEKRDVTWRSNSYKQQISNIVQLSQERTHYPKLPEKKEAKPPFRLTFENVASERGIKQTSETKRNFGFSGKHHKNSSTKLLKSSIDSQIPSEILQECSKYRVDDMNIAIRSTRKNFIYGVRSNRHIRPIQIN